MKLIETEFDKTYNELNKLYEAVGDRLPDFRSPNFYSILDGLNSILKDYSYMPKPITYDDGELFDSGFDKNWKIKLTTQNSSVTIDKVKKLEQIILNNANIKVFKDFIRFSCTVTTLTIIIFISRLPDNTWTADDLDKYGIDPTVTKRLDELEDRMYRRADDTYEKRSKATRWADFKFAKNYENALNKNDNLIGIKNLSLAHDNDKFSINPDRFADFIGDIIPPAIERQHIEGKSGYINFTYDEKIRNNNLNFGIRFSKLVNDGSLGSLHNNTAYILFLNKVNGDLICIKNTPPYDINWKAGTLDINSLK